MTAQTPDLDALKSILFDAINDADLGDKGCGPAVVYEGDASDWDGEPPGDSWWVKASIQADKLAATIQSKVAAPLLADLHRYQEAFEMAKAELKRGYAKREALEAELSEARKRVAELEVDLNHAASKFEKLEAKGGEQ